MTAWWTLALVFAGPDPAWLGTALASVYALGTLAILLWLRPFAWALAACGLAFVALLIWWSTIRPSNEGDWQADVARLARVEVRGEQLIVHNVRNFDYRTESDFTPRYVDRTYDLSALRGVDVFMSYWGSPAIAHTIMSWQFDNAPPLAISIETRKRKGQEYSAVKGFFKQYEIIYVVADERDVVGLRTNHRGEAGLPLPAEAPHRRWPGRCCWTTSTASTAWLNARSSTTRSSTTARRASAATWSMWIRTLLLSIGVFWPTATWTSACTTEASWTRACPSKSCAG